MNHVVKDGILLFLPMFEIDPSVQSLSLAHAVLYFHLNAIWRLQVGLSGRYSLGSPSSGLTWVGATGRVA